METALVLAALKGAASAAGSSGVKFLWEKAFKREARAADAVIAMAIIRAIEESRSQGVGADEAWWSRAGQRLIAPFVHKDVARYVLEAAISEPGNPPAVRETLVVALQSRDQDFSQLAIDLRFDEQKFLSSLPSIIADELRSAGAELNSPLLFLAQYAALLRIDRNVSSASAIGLDDSTRALAASTRVLLTQFTSRMAQFRVYIFDDFAAAGERLLSAEWDAYLRDADGPVLDLHWDLMGWTEVLEELTGERPRLTSVLDDCRRLKVRLEDAEVQMGTVFRDAGGIDVTGELDLLTSYLDGLDAGDSDQPPVKSQTRLLLLLARAAQAAFGDHSADINGQMSTRIQGIPVTDRDWLANLLGRLEHRPRRSELPPCVPEAITAAELSLITGMWDRFAGAQAVRELLVQQLTRYESSCDDHAADGARTNLSAGLQQALNGYGSQTVPTAARDAASGTFARRNAIYGIAFELRAPAPDEDPVSLEVLQTGWTQPVVLGRLSRDESRWGSQDPAPFWMHEVELSAVTRAGRWRRLELLTDLLDQPETAPMNRQGARGYVEFGGESITTCWTFVDGATVTLDDVRWWVVRWPEERGRFKHRELLRPDTAPASDDG